MVFTNKVGKSETRAVDSIKTEKRQATETGKQLLPPPGGAASSSLNTTLSLDNAVTQLLRDLASDMKEMKARMSKLESKAGNHRD